MEFDSSSKNYGERVRVYLPGEECPKPFQYIVKDMYYFAFENFKDYVMWVYSVEGILLPALPVSRFVVKRGVEIRFKLINNSEALTFTHYFLHNDKDECLMCQQFNHSLPSYPGDSVIITLILTI